MDKDMKFNYKVKWILRPPEYWPNEVEKFTLVDGKWLTTIQVIVKKFQDQGLMLPCCQEKDE